MARSAGQKCCISGTPAQSAASTGADFLRPDHGGKMRRVHLLGADEQRLRQPRGLAGARLAGFGQREEGRVDALRARMACCTDSASCTLASTSCMVTPSSWSISENMPTTKRLSASLDGSMPCAHQLDEAAAHDGLLHHEGRAGLVARGQQQRQPAEQRRVAEHRHRVAQRVISTPAPMAGELMWRSSR